MLHHSLLRPKLLIDGVEVKSFTSGSFNDSGNSQIQTLSANFSDPDLEDTALFGKKVELFLNNGSEDGAPLFRGFIKQFNSTDSSISVSALDPRMLLVGQDVTPTVIDEKNNFDGHTIIQFLISYIENEINVNETLINTKYLHEMDRPVFMTGVRGTQNPYATIQTLVQNKIDDESFTDRSDSNKIFDYFIDIIHGGTSSGPTIRKKRALDGNADMYFKYGDGITSLNYKERAPPSYILGTTGEEKSEQVIFGYGNAPMGVKGFTSVGVKGESRGELRENLISRLILEQRYTKDITLVVSKGYSLSIGNIIHIEVPKLNLYGNYEITGKSISVGDSLSCTFTCNNRPIKLSDYLSV